MSDSYIQNLFSERIGGVSYGKDTAIYKFEKIKRAKKAALEANPDDFFGKPQERGSHGVDIGLFESDSGNRHLHGQEFGKRRVVEL